MEAYCAVARRSSYMMDDAARDTWAAVSKSFAQGASGEVHVFLRWGYVSPNSIWMQVERDALEQNPNVTSILVHARKDLGPASVFRPDSQRDEV